MESSKDLIKVIKHYQQYIRQINPVKNDSKRGINSEIRSISHIAQEKGSILTVPWIELGGTTSINCPQTGYYCNIEFLTKPFYGGKKHRISGEIFAPKDKKPFLTITGEWNGSMEAKWTEGPAESFVDTRRLPIIKKRVRRIEEQAENESRKIWKEVTLGLKYNNVDQATNAKIHIEQKQREEAQARKEKNEKWEPRYFYEEEGAWHYRNPLEKRMNVQITRPPTSLS